MNKRFYFFLMTLLFLAKINTFANEDKTYFYKVEKGDDLGTIMYSMGLVPLWGKGGVVSQTIGLKTNKLKKEGNLIFVNQKISLPSFPRFSCNIIENNNQIKIIKKINSSKKFDLEFKKISEKCNGPMSPKRKIASIKKDREKKKVDQFSRLSEILILPKFSFTKIKAVDTENYSSSTVFSKVNKGFDIAWAQFFSKRFFTKYQLSYEAQSYDPNPNREFIDDSLSLMSAELKAQYKVFSQLSLSASLNYGEDIFLYAPDVETLRLDKAQGLSSKIGVVFTKEFQPFVFDIELGFEMSLEKEVKDYKSEQALGYYTKLGLTHKNILGSISYKTINRESTDFNQEFTQLDFSLGLKFEYGN